MFDAELQTRMAQLWMDAMVGYSRAAANAYAIAFERSMDVWCNALRQPGEGNRASPPPASFMAPAWASQQPAFWGAECRAWPQQTMPNPLNLWAAWTSLSPGVNPWRTAMSVWPMVVVMMSFGVPREVAVPAAEANAAAMDANEAAAKSVQRIFSSYRSDGGHASAQIIWLKNLTAIAAFLPLSATGLPNWLFPPHTF
jgi:hypothetical protein